jgi:hypothetical protein
MGYLSVNLKRIHALFKKKSSMKTENQERRKQELHDSSGQFYSC